ncbi:hypothetical protein LOTGIDRAFT_238291 [Lottia gigantea]|uniref:RING-type domain-containing protein n=1 Tax=Lottia gigantea TaxID=225164 RepID=V4CHB6_LOTGI|nr:hypothetical protein LOTGIDRAFT_238291 [Lottia gigantea]ESP01505.1 hypothetical protein LOTGIDRAFT_238291 [Lottia gigantea]
MAGRGRLPQTSRRKRPHPPVFGGTSSSFKDKDNDYACPICFEIIDEAHMTKCGHSFCFRCIKQSLERSNRCPKCYRSIENPAQIFPNFTLNDMILKYKEDKSAGKRNKCEQSTSKAQEEVGIGDVNNLLDLLVQKKHKLEADGKVVETFILKEFLQQIKERKEMKLKQIKSEIEVLESDITKVDDDISEYNQKYCPDHLVPSGFDVGRVFAEASDSTETNQDGFNGSKNVDKVLLQPSLASRRKKLSDHFNDLEQCYFSVRVKEVTGVDNGSNAGLEEFTESLSKFFRFSSCRPLATLNYSVDLYGASCIVSSIEFDRDCDYFAIAGVTKKIKIYEYGVVIKDAVDIHYPMLEMMCNSKISCVTWSTYYKNVLASSDYEGTVTLWDVNTNKKTKKFQEHEKRCWSVDFNGMDPKLIASASDDAKVKLWSTNNEHSIANIEANANVCCVKFNPQSRYHLAFGSADHNVHYYDLRNTKQALAVFSEHKKAVSYVKFLNSTEIVSASTDSQLKLWDISHSFSKRTFEGHTNEKNFVGLATDGDYITCGSENHALYFYYKGLAKELMTFKFDSNLLEKDSRKPEDHKEFVSAVTWKPNSNVVVAANSQGTVKVIELV